MYLTGRVYIKFWSIGGVFIHRLKVVAGHIFFMFSGRHLYFVEVSNCVPLFFLTHLHVSV